MNTKVLLPLALVVVFFTGCAHQTTRTGSKTNVLFGLVEVERGAYQPASEHSFSGSSNEYIGNSAKVSGTQTKVLWGLFTNNDY